MAFVSNQQQQQQQQQPIPPPILTKNYNLDLKPRTIPFNSFPPTPPGSAKSSPPLPEPQNQSPLTSFPVGLSQHHHHPHYYHQQQQQHPNPSSNHIYNPYHANNAQHLNYNPANTSTSPILSPSSPYHPNHPHSSALQSHPSTFNHVSRLPARRHHYLIPQTPNTEITSNFPGNPPSLMAAFAPNLVQPSHFEQHSASHPIYSAHSTSNYDNTHHHHYHPHNINHHSSWDGTLSSLITTWTKTLREQLFINNDARRASYTGSTSPLLASTSANTPQLVSELVKNLKLVGGISTSSIKFGLLCCLWYSTSALSSNTGKVILNRFRYPVTLTIVQFAFVALWSGLVISLRDGHGNLASHRGNRGTSVIACLGIRRPNRSTIRGTCIMSLFSIAGHVFSSMAIARVPVSTVHTIKALSPLFTVIAYAGLFGVRYGFNTYFSLLPLTLGVMLACSFDMRANGIGFLCALGSTVIFVSQNIFGKKLLPKENNNSGTGTGSKHSRQLSTGGAGSGQMDKLNLLFYSSAIAFVLMIPIWIWIDLSGLIKLWMKPIEAQGLNDLKEGSSLNHTTLGLMMYFICNGTVHFGQCILAFSILSKTSPVTYSIASLIKRVAVICIAIIWFGQKVSSIQAIGMMMTFIGLYIYNRSKSEIEKGERKRGQIERKQELILPIDRNEKDCLNNLEDQEEDKDNDVMMKINEEGFFGGDNEEIIQERMMKMKFEEFNYGNQSNVFLQPLSTTTSQPPLPPVPSSTQFRRESNSNSINLFSPSITRHRAPSLSNNH